MNIEFIENKIIDYFEGEISQEGRDEVERLISNSPEVESIYDKYKEIYQDIDVQEMFAPDTDMNVRFQDMLSNYSDTNVEKETNPETKTSATKESGFNLNTKLLMGIVALLLLIFGLLIGLNVNNYNAPQQLDPNMYVMQTEMHDLLKQRSTSDRIKAVNLTQEMQKIDSDVLDVLIKTMNEDRSANVRLAAVNALSRHTRNDKVKASFIETLSKQNDPSVQIELINILSNIKESDAINEFDKLIEDESTLKFVKDEAYFGKIKLETY